MPDCYHVVSSRPEETGRDIRGCVGSAGGPGRLRELRTDGDRVHSRVRYQTREQAERHLKPLTRCLENKGHTVHRAEVVEDDADLGIDRYHALSDEGDTPA